MSVLGRNLLFYGKYWDEMESLYWNEEYSLLDSEPDRDIIIESINKIGEQASGEGRNLLSRIQSRLCEEIRRGGNYQGRPTKIRDGWDFKIWVYQSQITERRVLVGGSFDFLDDKCVLKSWVWVKGGRPAGAALHDLLKVGELGSDNAIRLGVVPLPQFEHGVDVPDDRFCKQVLACFGPVLKRLQKVWRLASETY